MGRPSEHRDIVRGLKFKPNPECPQCRSAVHILSALMQRIHYLHSKLRLLRPAKTDWAFEIAKEKRRAQGFQGGLVKNETQPEDRFRNVG